MKMQCTCFVQLNTKDEQNEILGSFSCARLAIGQTVSNLIKEYLHHFVGFVEGGNTENTKFRP